MGTQKRTILRVFALGLAGLFLGLTLGLFTVAALFGISQAAADLHARVLPSYPREDISALIEKEELTDEDYRVLYLQTGLGKDAVDALDRSRLAVFQDSLFYRGNVIHEMVAFGAPYDKMEHYIAPVAPLENGDVIVTSSCHTLGWRNGHSALVVNASSRYLLQSFAPGVDSAVGTIDFFTYCSNFIVLRLKDKTKEERALIARWAMNNLNGIPYSLTVGIFSPKDQGDSPTETNCSHLVWQAYRHFGYDIDSDGGPVVTSRDIANSPCFEVVQVYGFDPITLW